MGPGSWVIKSAEVHGLSVGKFKYSLHCGCVAEVYAPTLRTCRTDMLQHSRIVDSYSSRPASSGRMTRAKSEQFVHPTGEINQLIGQLGLPRSIIEYIGFGCGVGA
jgi:hypothetical protein